MIENKEKQEILRLLTQKSSVKQDVYQQTIANFELLKTVLREFSEDLSAYVSKQDPRVIVEYSEKAKHVIQLRFAGDILVFYMHTNVFAFPENHKIWKYKYVKTNDYRSLCGVIQVYNFLNDSFVFNRVNDIGVMVARIFNNMENHYFAEGDEILDKHFGNISLNKFTKVEAQRLVEHLVLNTLNFDLITPPIENVQAASVNELTEITKSIQFVTSKKLGYKMSWEQKVL